jgi:hypothetical protein
LRTRQDNTYFSVHVHAFSVHVVTVAHKWMT